MLTGPFCDSHEKKYPKKTILSTTIWEGKKVLSYPHEHTTHLINIHKNIFKIHNGEPLIHSLPLCSPLQSLLQCLLCQINFYLNCLRLLTEFLPPRRPIDLLNKNGDPSVSESLVTLTVLFQGQESNFLGLEWWRKSEPALPGTTRNEASYWVTPQGS